MSSVGDSKARPDTGDRGMDDKALIQGFLSALLRKKRDMHDFSDTESLFASGRLASVDALDVVLLLEEKYGIDFSDGFDRDQIDSVDSILSLIRAGRPA
jgi:acyl carrier protein